MAGIHDKSHGLEWYSPASAAPAMATAAMLERPMARRFSGHATLQFPPSRAETLAPDQKAWVTRYSWSAGVTWLFFFGFGFRSRRDEDKQALRQANAPTRRPLLRHSRQFLRAASYCRLVELQRTQYCARDWRYWRVLAGVRLWPVRLVFRGRSTFVLDRMTIARRTAIASTARPAMLKRLAATLFSATL